MTGRAHRKDRGESLRTPETLGEHPGLLPTSARVRGLRKTGGGGPRSSQTRSPSHVVQEFFSRDLPGRGSIRPHRAGTRVSGQTPERTPTAAAGESATCVHVTADGRLTRRGRRGSRRPPPACQSAPLATVTRRGRAGLRGGTDGLPSPPRAAGADADGSGHGASECGASGGGDWTPAGPSQPRAPAPPALPGCFPRAGHVLGTQDEISGRAISVFPMPAPWLWRPPPSS